MHSFLRIRFLLLYTFSSVISSQQYKNNNSHNYIWLSNHAVQYAINEYDRLEVGRNELYPRDPVANRDRRESSPFLHGDVFRTHCYPFLCEEETIRSEEHKPVLGENCRIDVTNLTDGICIFVKASHFEYFTLTYLSMMNNKVVVVTDKQDDQSIPDGQDLSILQLKQYRLNDKLKEFHKNGTLISLHATNLYWYNFSRGETVIPSYAHCIPIGLENRDCSHGNMEIYIKKLKDNIINRKVLQHGEVRPLLLVSFSQKGAERNKPDRLKAHRALSKNGFLNHKPIDHNGWLDAISLHRFTASPHGHGLDTHRMMEILILGGIPVIRRSTISSCYDDTDNTIGNMTRGSIPVVVVGNWEEVTIDFLEKEWLRISKYPQSHWDWHRLFAPQWLERLHN